MIILSEMHFCYIICKNFQQLTRNQYKGYLKALQTCIAGLEYSYNSSGSNGLASLFHVLEIAHSHYWTKETEVTSPPSASGSLVNYHLSRELIQRR